MEAVSSLELKSYSLIGITVSHIITISINSRVRNVFGNLIFCFSFPALLTSGSPFHEATDMGLAVEECAILLWIIHNAAQGDYMK
jgi:hypothetical protein